MQNCLLTLLIPLVLLYMPLVLVGWWWFDVCACVCVHVCVGEGEESYTVAQPILGFALWISNLHELYSIAKFRHYSDYNIGILCGVVLLQASQPIARGSTLHIQNCM